MKEYNLSTSKFQNDKNHVWKCNSRYIEPRYVTQIFKCTLVKGMVSDVSLKLFLPYERNKPE